MPLINLNYNANQEMLKKVLILLASFLSITAHAQQSRERWADSVMRALNIEERIAQTMIIPVDDENEIRGLVRKQKIGGIIFYGNSPVYQASLTNSLQASADVPLFVGMEAARGLHTIIDSVFSFPDPIVLGAIDDDSLLFRVGKAIGYQLHAIGVNLNFAPDVLFSTLSDTIDRMSLGESRESVAGKSVAMMKGMQSQGVFACAKYYPTSLTVGKVQRGIPSLRDRLDSAQAFVFGQLIKEGVIGVLPTPRNLPLFYERRRAAKKNTLPSSALSSLLAGSTVRKELKFDNGLLFASIPAAYQAGEQQAGAPEALAFQSGNDVLVAPQNVNAAIRRIKKLIAQDKDLATQLDQSVKKILMVKYDLLDGQPVIADNLVRRLNDPGLQVLKQNLLEGAVTVIRNDANILPIRNLETTSVACLMTGLGSEEFTHYLKRYSKVDVLEADTSSDDNLIEQLNHHDVVIVGVFPQTALERERLHQLLTGVGTTRVICDFTSMRDPTMYSQAEAVIKAYTNDVVMIRVVPEVIFGAIQAKGKLPVSLSGQQIAGTGIVTDSLSRLGFGLPEGVGISSKALEEIRSIAWEGIDSGATPGCSMMIARHGRIIFQETFGWYTYNDRIPVNESTIYDLASVTKVASTLQAFIFLYEKGYFDLDKKASVYLPELRGSNKEDFTLIDILTHQSGLWPYLPFWKQTMKDTTLLPEYYSRTPSEKYSLQVAKNLYTLSSMPDSLWKWIISARIEDKTPRVPYGYVYSDMGFYIMQHLCEQYLNQPIEDFVSQNLYEPLGAYEMGFLPLNRFPESMIAPTENDLGFRKTQLIGTVHDQGAALSGGVAGHAGLFGSVNDLMKLGQMLLQEGYYGGVRYYKPEIVDMFTVQQFKTSHRGLGWNKPVQSNWVTATSMLASPKTFGHTGFTGTCIWVDPEFDLVYVFLSNRVYPDMNNSKLISMNIRSRIQDVIYESIFEYCKAPTTF